MAIDQSVINFAVYEDSVEYLGMSKVTLPDVTFLTQSISGAGVGGNVEAVILGHLEAMTLGLDLVSTPSVTGQRTSTARRCVSWTPSTSSATSTVWIIWPVSVRPWASNPHMPFRRSCILQPRPIF